MAADGRRLNGCGQTGKVTHAGNEERRSLGRLPNPWVSLLNCLPLAPRFLQFASHFPGQQARPCLLSWATSASASRSAPFLLPMCLSSARPADGQGLIPLAGNLFAIVLRPLRSSKLVLWCVFVRVCFLVG